jgi:hypothetical protein
LAQVLALAQSNPALAQTLLTHSMFGGGAVRPSLPQPGATPAVTYPPQVCAWVGGCLL